MANTYLTRTPSSTGDRRKWTWSGWLKRTTTGANYIFTANNADAGGSNYSMLQFNADDELRWYDYSGGGFTSQLVTDRRFRDTNGYYHIVIIYDSAQATAADRIKFYINGVQETSFYVASYPSQNYDSYMNFSGYPNYIGRETGTGSLFNGIMSFVNFTDGYAYAPTEFGETDSLTGEWKIKIDTTVTYGTNGYFIFKDGTNLSGSTVQDQSGQGNNFTVTAGTLTDTKDCPDNVFATMNVLDKNTNVVLTNGSNSLSTTNNGNWVNASRATLGIRSGKVYWEMKITGSGTSSGYFFGICADTVNLNTTSGLQDTSAERAKGMLLFCDDGQYQLDNNSRQSMTSGAALNDVLACAVDRSSNNVKFYKNGAQVGSIDISSSPLATVSDIMPLTIGYYTALQLNHNFGNGVFGTSTVSSSGTSASTPGTFEYDVPSGYQPLSTKGLNA